MRMGGGLVGGNWRKWMYSRAGPKKMGNRKKLAWIKSPTTSKLEKCSKRQI